MTELLSRDKVCHMRMGERLRALREEKKLSQGDIERRTGMRRAYLSRVENGHTAPSIETLQKWAHALEVPLYAIFYDGSARPKPLILPSDIQSGESRKNARFMNQLLQSLARMDDRHRQLLLQMARRIATRKSFGRK